MSTSRIDISLPPELQDLVQAPVCVPLPQPGKMQITLPTGGAIKGIADASKGIPDDCALSFSLVLPLLTFLGNFECLFKVLKLIEPLIDVVKSLGPPPDPLKLPEAIKKFLEAATDLAPCLLVPTPAAMIPFVRDILCLVIKLLNCIVGQLKSIMGVMGGLALQLQSAEAAGNRDLVAALQCAQGNAQISAQHAFASLEPILLILSLAEPFLGIVGVDPIQTPALASPEDLESMQSAVNSLDELVKTLTLAAELVGGC